MNADQREKHGRLPSWHFTTRSLFLMTLGIAATVAVFAASHPTSRAMGWLGLGVFLFCRRQQTLFWMHVALPAFLGIIAFALADEQSFFTLGNPSQHEAWARQGTWLHLLHCVGDAGMFLAMITLPFSFLRVDG